VSVIDRLMKMKCEINKDFTQSMIIRHLIRTHKITTFPSY